MLMFVVDIVLNFRTALVQDDEINENPSVRTRAAPVAVRSAVLDHGWTGLPRLLLATT